MKHLLERILAFQLKRLLRKNPNLVTVAVAGSVGKTGTKLAIAHVLKQQKKVVFQEGNYNVPLTIPLVYFEQKMPSHLVNIFAWLAIIVKNEFVLRKPYPYEIAVIEMGIDHPGEMRTLRQLVTPDVAVVTAVSYEHMANFVSLDQVAQEELSILQHAKKAFVCADSVDRTYITQLHDVTTYGVSHGEIRLVSTHKKQDTKQDVVLKHNDKEICRASVSLLGKHSLTAASAAATVAYYFQFDPVHIAAGLAELEPFSGRMKPLKGLNNSTIIDDTYNASPEAVLMALSTLYDMKATQKIAVLGSMNELGSFSEESHRNVGRFCNPEQLDVVVTIGSEAERFLAPAAKNAGCKVVSYASPYEAGKHVASILQEGAVVLFKGSQNGVFAEEAIKSVLADKNDESLLVRQSLFWLDKKAKQFSAASQAQ